MRDRFHSSTPLLSLHPTASQATSAWTPSIASPGLRCFAIVLLSASVCACRPEGREHSGQTGDSLDTLNVVTLTAIDYAFDAPQAIQSGWTTFRLVNRGTQLHAAQLVKLEEGHTLPEFLAAYEHAWRTVGPRPRWGRRSGGPGATEPNQSSNATMYLEPGNYAWYCPMNVEDGVPHVFGKGMARPFVVEPRVAATPQTGPQATVVVQLSDYAFSLSTPLTAGRHVIKLENRGAEPHEFGLLKLASEKTLQDFQAWARGFQGPPPANVIGGVSALAAHAEAYFNVDLTPGNYLFVCFVTAPDGRPHVDHGMIQEVSVR
jgi:hypothetical protein